MNNLNIHIASLLGRVGWRLVCEDISKAIYVATLSLVSHLLTGALSLEGSGSLLVLAIGRE
jgi:hypothetical protein